MKKIRLILALLLAVLMLTPSGAWLAAAFGPERAPEQSGLQVMPVKTCPAGSDRPYPPCYLWP